MTTPTPEMIAKLPKWAQVEMEDLKRRAERAQRALRTLMDNTTPSKCWLTEHTLNIMDRFYLPHDRVTFSVAGGEITIYPQGENAGLEVMLNGGSLLIKPHVTNRISISAGEL